MESILIKDIDIYLDGALRQGDVLIVDGKIQAVDARLNYSAELVINEPGLTLLPGLIDAHVHFREPGLTHKETFKTGSMAAAAGGVTTIMDMPNTAPSTTTRIELAEKQRIASETSLVNCLFFIGATANNIDECREATHIAGIKLFLGSSTGDLLLEEIKFIEPFFTTPHLIAVHAENESVIKANKSRMPAEWSIEDHENIRSVESSLQAIKFIIEIAKKHHHPMHILHLSSEAEVHYLSQHKIPGLISAEVTPQHLTFHSPDVYQLYGTLAKVNPPIRKESDRKALIQGLKSGIIDTIGSDHAPHTLAEKMVPAHLAPSGMPMIEHTLPLLLDQLHQGILTLPEIVRATSQNPARIFQLTSKAHIKPGFDADLVLVDLNAKRRITNEKLYTKAKWSILNDRACKGCPIITIVNGQMVFREGDFFYPSI